MWDASLNQTIRNILNADRTRGGWPRFNWLPVAIALVVLAAWYLLTLDSAAAFIVASPGAVAQHFVMILLNGTLLKNIGTTLLEIGLGFALGVACAFVLGYGIARSRILEQAIGPYAVGFQAVPIIAIAPVLIRFFGPGMISIAIICALIVFFPMLVSTMVGIRNVSPELHELMRSLSATRWQTFTQLEIPAALPVLFGGLKICATLSVVGAVVGELVGSQAGLGFMIYQARYVYDSAGVLVGVFTLTGLALALYEVVARIERLVLRWQRAGN